MLERCGAAFDVRPVDVVEEFRGERDPKILARRLAREKAEAARLQNPDSPIISADTVVWHRDEPLGKPRDVAEARTMLRALSGEPHTVVSAIVVIRAGSYAIVAREPATEVRIRELSDEEIERSIGRGTPFDKAGGYAIQDHALDPVEAYEGCYCNVMGLSLFATIELLTKVGLGPELGPPDLLPECSQCPLARQG